MQMMRILALFFEVSKLKMKQGARRANTGELFSLDCKMRSLQDSDATRRNRAQRQRCASDAARARVHMRKSVRGNA